VKHQHNHRDPACLAVFARLSEFIDGELPEMDCAEIEAHIADCPPCIDFLNSLKKCQAASKDFHSTEKCPPAPPELEQKLKAAWAAALSRRG
jgi:RNA polymerase sigma-70 factor (ECF subfamily)